MFKIDLEFIIFDMQLAPVNGSPIFSSFDDIHWHGSLNGAVFLDQGNHRFRNDPEWGEILQRVQVGDVTEDDITKINQRLLDKVQLPDLVDCTERKIVYGCFTNKRRNEITNACFLQFVSKNSPRFESVEEASAETLLIKGFVSRDYKDVGPDFHKLLWGMCGDNNISVKGNTKIDPFLKLIRGSPLMINSNTEKAQKLCKGTTGNFVGFRWKEGCRLLLKGKDLGFIAQQVEPISPYLVKTRESGYKAVDYKKISVLIVSAIKERNSHLQKIKLKIKLLKNG